MVLSQKFSADWLELLRAGIDADLQAPIENFTRHTKDPNAPAYLEDYRAWRKIPQFFLNSPCGPIASELLGAAPINLVMDNGLLREAGSTSRPPFHRDLSYFDFEGSMCGLRLPLEPVSKDDGIAFVRGSHLWDKLFMRVRFADGHPRHEPTQVAGCTYHPPPDVNADPAAYDLLQWVMDLGDCINFDLSTLYGGLSSATPTETVRRFTLRMTGPDGVIRYRGDWAKEERAQFQAADYAEGDRIVAGSSRSSGPAHRADPGRSLSVRRRTLSAGILR